MGKNSGHMRSTNGRRRTRRWRAVTTSVASLAVIAGLAACEPQPPPPPRPVISVNTVAAGADANPGDGTCEATASGGNCTLQAAIGEANALGTADIVVPDGVYPKFSPTITGNLRINWDAPRDVHVAGRWAVAEGGFLAVEGLSRHATGNTTIPVPQIAQFVPSDFGIRVSGTLLARSLSLFGSDEVGTLSIGETGTAMIEDSQVDTFLSGVTYLTFSIYNSGYLAMDNVVAFHPYSDGIGGGTCETDGVCWGPTTALYATDGSQTHVSNSVIARVPTPMSTCGPTGSAGDGPPDVQGAAGADASLGWVAPFDCEVWNYSASCHGPVNLLGGNRIADIVVPGNCGTTTIEIPAGSPGPTYPPALSTWTNSIPAGCPGPVAGCYPEWWTFVA